MSDQREAHPKNVPGPFYVENGCCLTCLAPHNQAPSLMGFDDASSHCFVKRQPETDEELYRAVRAVFSAELECLRYRGSDPNVQLRLIEIGRADSCDSPSPNELEPVLRNHVTFATTLTDPDDVALSFREFILTQDAERKTSQVTQPKRKGELVTIAYSWCEDNFYTLIVGSGEASTNRVLVQHSPIWEIGSIGLSLMIDDWLRSDDRFSDLRWYTSEAWDRGGEEWQEKPY